MFTSEIKIATLAWARTGSRETCNPPPMDTDEDFIVLVQNEGAFGNLLTALGWNLGGSQVFREIAPLPADEVFSSWTRGDCNLIVTESPVFYDRFVRATLAAKSLNLLHKPDRIKLFQAVLYSVVEGNRRGLPPAP